MINSPSSEFIALCRSQSALVTSLGASLSAVYLAEDFNEGNNRKLIPILVFPDTEIWDSPSWLDISSSSSWETIKPAVILPDVRPKLIGATGSPIPNQVDQNLPEASWPKMRQMVFPLSHDGTVMGFLVTARDDRAWTSQEEVQLQAIAHSLALACVLDQRKLWWQKELNAYQDTTLQQYHTFHNLLHQLKSPITALKTFGKLLLKRLLPDDKNRQIADSIIQQSDRLQELLQQFDRTVDLGEASLTVIAHQATVTNHHPSVWTEDYRPPLPIKDLPALPASSDPLPLLPSGIKSCQLIDVLTPLVQSFEAIAEEKNINFQADIPPNLPQIISNAQTLREVFSNLIDNAIKYTPSSGKVYIKVILQADQIGIGISDTGPGIPPEDLANLFQRYYRGRQAQTDIPGTGLGLAIVRELLTEIQGKVEVFSPVLRPWIPPKWLKKNQKGTTFIVWLIAIPPLIKPG